MVRRWCGWLAAAIVVVALTHVTADQESKCGPAEYRCNDGRCIEIRQCSSLQNCDDVCRNSTSCIQDNQFECTLTKKCIPNGWVCDGDVDCGIHEKYGEDKSDEAPNRCLVGVKCQPNEEHCNDKLTCLPIEMFCDNHGNCPDNSDEWDFCRNVKFSCNNTKCDHGCRPTVAGPKCFCPQGESPEGEKCVDMDECMFDSKCDQLCQNTVGSYKCSCVEGYQLYNMSYCNAINDPVDEEPSIIFSTQRDIRRIKLDGTPWSGNSTLKLLNSHALEFNFENRSICYIYNKVTKSSFCCSSIDDLNEKWYMPSPSLFPELESIHQISLDWVSGNWYFLDDHKEIILICNSTLEVCDILLEVDLSKPRGIALDPTRGVMFFTKWGYSAPTLERCDLNGSNREEIVTWKIVYPYGVTVDIPSAMVYWVDTYLDFVERVDYYGKSRKIIKQGNLAQNLYSVSIFELNLFVTSWQNQSIIRLNNRNADNYKVIHYNISRPYSVHIFHRQKQPIVQHPCKTHNGGCMHLCIPAYTNDTKKPYANCMCKPGFRLRGHGECVLENRSTFLIYGKGKPPIIKAIGISPNQKNQMMIPITEVAHPAVFDFDYKEQYIYFSDIEKNIIQRQQINGPIRETILSTDKHGAASIRNCEGLSIDWISRLLYWSDESLHIISAMPLSNFDKKKTLIHDPFMNPRSIVVDPKRGIMFWSEWQINPDYTGKIEKAWLDGTNREVLVNKELHWPNSLTIDYDFGYLYWCDIYLEKIERIHVDGTSRSKRTQLSAAMRPYSLTYHDGFLFWTEYNRGMIYRLNLSNNVSEILAVENPPLFDIKMYSEMSQTGNNECSMKNCSELCFNTPNGAVCSCTDGYTLSGAHCVSVKNYTAPLLCDKLFQCKNNNCIEKKFVCDGNDDCNDGSDEDASPGAACENTICRSDQFKCDITKCITNFWVCDGDKDCNDGTDEEPIQCKNSTCSSVQFRCKISGKCIPIAWKCDSDYDCGDNDTSDEINCEYRKCNIMEFACDNKECVSFDNRCDGRKDCRDGSDELNCPKLCDNKTMIYCAVHEGCFPIQYKCNGVEDCPDGSDEEDCPPDKLPTSKHHLHPNSSVEINLCEAHEFRCADSVCIPMPFKCDGSLDCLDGSDELLCPLTTTTPAPMTTTTTTESPHAIPCDKPSRRCDNDTRCIAPDILCDSVYNCVDRSDEGFLCSEKVCEKIFECSHMCHNTPEGFICSCPPGLHLQPDGLRCSEVHPCSSWGICSQECEPHHSRHKCVCHEGFQLASDGFSCKSTDPAVPYIIFSNRHELRRVDLQTMQGKPLLLLLKNTIAIDYYYSESASVIFWTDVVDDKIYRGNMIDGSLSNVEVVIQSGLTTAEGLAVDWIGNNLYWVESNLDQIEVAKLNGSFRRTLVAGDMESPRAISVDPRYGLLFWTDWDVFAPRIERCTMAGNSRKIIVQVDKVPSGGAWPNGLILDYESKRVYWIDAKSDSIHTVTYEGSDHRLILKGHEFILHPFAIALYENYVYWTDWRTNSLMRANKWNGSDTFTIQKIYAQPFDLTVMHPSRQPKVKSNPCEKNNGGCSHLCLLDGESLYKCACAHVMILGPDKKTCFINEKVLLFGRANEIRGVDLNMPYYHTIPTISVSQVINPQQIDFVAKTNTFYWADTQLNEIKSSNLTKGPAISVVDTDIKSIKGFAIDWMSELMFFSSSETNNQISVCNLKGEFRTALLSKDINNVNAIAVDPIRGKLYWAHQINESNVIESSYMDGSDRNIINSQINNTLLISPTSLIMDFVSLRLYWVNTGSIQYYDISQNVVKTVPLPAGTEPTATVPYFNKLYYTTNHDAAIHICDKTNCENDTLLRNNTGNVLSLRIYDTELQVGNNSCSKNHGGCHHLCLPTGPYTRTCACATGYYVDTAHPNKCIGIQEFLFYSISWEIRGLRIVGNSTSEALGPISHVSVATSIDFHAATDHLYWADSDDGTVSRIKRDGTEREVLIEDNELVEVYAMDRISGLAIDWIAGNMYWGEPRRNVISVSRLNGSSKYVLLVNELEIPTVIVLDPVQGLMFFTGGSSIQRSGLDGSNHILLCNKSGNALITDLTLDYNEKKLYWTESGSQVIMEMNYNGSSQKIILNNSSMDPVSLTYFNNHLYWIYNVNYYASIVKAPVKNMTDQTNILMLAGETLRDIHIFSKQRQKGTNPCAMPFNGGCSELCLYDGKQAKCACPHGNVAADGKTCQPYSAFLMYSRIVKIESINMFDTYNHNAPYPTIQHRDLRNAIGLAYDYKTSRIFYSDIQIGSINAAFFNGSGHTVIVENQGRVEGLAYDSLSNYLYFTCNNNATINKLNLTKAFQAKASSASDANRSKVLVYPVASLNDTKPSLVERVVKLEKNDKPRGIAVDSCRMKIYWTNWNSNSPSIQRAYTNGFNKESIITTDILMPNGLTLDHKAQKLYWADARLDKIERTEYDGSKRVVITKGTPAHPFALAIYGDSIFWTDWVLSAVIRADKISGLNIVRLRKDIPKPMGIVAIAEDNENCMLNPCLVMNGGCSEICKLNAHGQVVCECKTGYRLAADGHQCISTQAKCQEGIPSNTFTCSSGGCIPLEITCDGINHCSDGSDEDENYCATRKCNDGYFQCTNNRCILLHKVCDRENDCGDDSDEASCSCEGDFFRCQSGHCISSDMVCNMKADCPDVSDEKNCNLADCLAPNALGEKIPPDNTYLRRCLHTSPCIHLSWLCDGQNDCLDNSDEENCNFKLTPVANVTCSLDKFACSTNDCIPAQWRCDGEDDCFDSRLTGYGISSDELNCKHQCRSNQFTCGSEECIPASWQCDGSPDCTDGSDESLHCIDRTCSENEYKCGTTPRCIVRGWLCDGEADCVGGEDETPAAGCGSISCSPHSLQCANGRCTAKIYYCDGDDDCGDNSDEPPSCNNYMGNNTVCKNGQFACHDTGLCILSIFTCDGFNHCTDGSDEDSYYCDKSKQVGACAKTEFECENSACVNSTLLCDGRDDCGDFSDEKLCNINECLDPLTCAHICKDLQIGYVCSCKKGYKVSKENKRLCVDIDECADYPCGQVCRNTEGSFVCSCQDGFLLEHDRINCKANSRVPASIIFSNRYYNRKMNLANGETTLIAHNLTNAVGLDFDWAGQCIYWSDVTTNQGSNIKRLCDMNTTNIGGATSNATYQVLHSQILQNPDGLAVDWVGRNLYWCDKGHDTIEVSRLDGRHRKILLNQGLQEPRAIALDPRHGMMYWSDWGDFPHIGRAGMDGSNPHVIINSSLGWPNALSISHESRELYFADAKEDYIAVSDLDGKNVRILFNRAKNPSLNLHHIFAIAVWEGYVYWSDWETKTIERCEKYPKLADRQADVTLIKIGAYVNASTPCRTMAKLVHKPMDIRIYHPYRQRPVPNRSLRCNELNCSGLCLLTPGTDGIIAKCVCPENFILADDGYNCLPNCTTAHFICPKALKCIPFWWRCDTQDDCGDGSDEPPSCPSYHCNPGQFQCSNTKCIDPSQLCNGINDCGDGSDELDCDKFTCLSSQFKCKGNATISDRCIPSARRCDGTEDCPKGDDEQNCPPETCAPNHFHCDNGNCIPNTWVCDNDADCSDSSDETEKCKDRKCSSDSFRCNSGRCIPLSWQCDGDDDCPGGEDEPPSCKTQISPTCEPTYFRCKNNKCIPGRWHCDYDDDCGDKSDEENCSPRNCSESEFRCLDGRCIRGSHKCNGEYNCEDRSDELHCNTSCNANEFRCHDPKLCIVAQWKCDGDIDCADGSDEIGCEYNENGTSGNTCGVGMFACASSHGRCIPERWKCDNKDDCGDGSDENSTMCAHHVCLPSAFRCFNNKCISMDNWCDGKDDCGDQSDENLFLCKQSGFCTRDQFRCANTYCIAKNLTCNGIDNCGDTSDEVDCVKSACSIGTCSQLCVEKKGRYSCKCAPGYHMKSYGNKSTCEAMGDNAKLIVTSDADLRILDPHKADNNSHTSLLQRNHTTAGFKIGYHDILWGVNKTEIFWTEHRQRKIVKLVANTQDIIKHEAIVPHISDQSIITIISGMTEPRGIAIEWVSKRIYWTEGGGHVNAPGTIGAATIEGRMRTTLVSGLHEPQDIVVNPNTRHMFWASLGDVPKIERASLSGTFRTVLVSHDVQWPTSLALDIPASRLYWSDPKSSTLESIKIDGTDRILIKHFNFDEKPNKITIFEDTIFLSTFYGQNVLKMDKFGRDPLTYLVRGLNKISDMTVIQQQIQNQNITNACESSPCHQSTLCVLHSEDPGRRCLCPNGLIVSNSSAESEVKCIIGSTTVMSCSLHCAAGGTCEAIDGVERCACAPGYGGIRCERYRCARRCMHGGTCNPQANGSLKCACPPQFTGERCETPVLDCEGKCKNGGSCTKTGCHCKIPYTGSHCELCGGMECLNNGTCRYESTPVFFPRCICVDGWKGPQCQTNICMGYCINDDYCKVNDRNQPQCHCPAGRSGSRCEEDMCKDFCKNNGVCHVSSGRVFCVCPARFTGHHCEERLCQGNNCDISKEEEQSNMSPREGECNLNGTEGGNNCEHSGTCTKTAHSIVCRCPPQWGGAYCKIYVGHDSPCSDRCQNKGVCSIDSVIGQPRCHCLGGWRGELCDKQDPCWKYCHPSNGVCRLTPIGEPECLCIGGFGGSRCLFSPQQMATERSKQIWTGVGVSFFLIMLVVAVLSVLFLVYRRRSKSFSHSHLQDNIEINNPVYLQGAIDEDIEPIDRGFILSSDKNSGHFANPVYDSLYTGMGDSHAVDSSLIANSASAQNDMAADEKAGLLQSHESDQLS